MTFDFIYVGLLKAHFIENKNFEFTRVEVDPLLNRPTLVMISELEPSSHHPCPCAHPAHLRSTSAALPSHSANALSCGERGVLSSPQLNKRSLKGRKSIKHFFKAGRSSDLRVFYIALFMINRSAFWIFQRDTWKLFNSRLLSV